MNSNIYNYKNDIPANHPSNNPLKDTVHVIRWLPGIKSTIFVAGGWDGRVRAYQFEQRGNQSVLEMGPCLDFGVPVLAVEWISKGEVIVGLASGGLVAVSFNNNSQNELYKANAPVADIRYFQTNSEKILLVFLMNDTILIHNMNSNDRFPSTDLKLRHCIIAADLYDDLVAIALAGSLFTVVSVEDLVKNNSSNINYTKSELTSALASISICNTGSRKLIALASIDGRINKGEVSKLSSGGYKFDSQIIFRAHKESPSNSRDLDVLFPISACHFSGSSINNGQSLASCSSRGDLLIWDFSKKENALHIETKMDVSTCRFNQDGTLLAYALGYSWGKGIWGLKDVNYPPMIYVHIVDKNDLQC